MQFRVDGVDFSPELLEMGCRFVSAKRPMTFPENLRAVRGYLLGGVAEGLIGVVALYDKSAEAGVESLTRERLDKIAAAANVARAWITDNSGIPALS